MSHGQRTVMEVRGASTLHGVRAGPPGAPPVVFLHPVGLDLTWWGDQFAAFTRDREVMAFDLPGHGRSERPQQPPTFELMATALEDALDAVGDRPAHLVGMSVGGMIAQALTLRRPERVQSLSLVTTLCTFPEAVRGLLRERARVARTEGMARIAQLTVERWFPAAFREQRPDVVDRAAKILRLQDGEFHAAMWDMISGLDFEARLPTITCPTLVVVGSEDVNAPVAAGEKIAQLISGARLEVLPGLGHLPPVEAPSAFNDLLRAFLAEADAALGGRRANRGATPQTAEPE